MSKKQKLIPEIRFPEFKNEGEWEEVTLGYLSQIVKGEQLNRIELTETGKYPCQNGGINPSGYTDKFNTNENTITISEGGNSCGYINYMTSKFWLGGHCYKLVVNHRIDKSYLYQALKFNEEDIMRLRVGSGLPNIQQNAIRNFKFVISNFLPEQQKIASCLSSLDDLIKEHSQKLDLLKDHKKGLLQNLFPQEGEKLPKLRFGEFKGDWEVTTLEKISSAIFDGTHQTPNYTEEGIPFFSVENLISGNKNKFISREDYLLATTKNKPEKGDVLITRIGNIGFSTVVDWDYEFSVYVTLAVVKQSDKFISHYLNGYFQSDFYQKEIRCKSLLNAVPMKINMEELRKTKVQLPPTRFEQKKIAFCLSSLDELITAQTEKIEQLKLNKKGLMQGLFPKMID